MQKALTQMNVQIQHVISDITGWTGLAILDAVLSGERDPAALRQSRKSFQHYQNQISACEEEIEKLVVAFEPRVEPEERPLPPDRKRKRRGRKEKNFNPKTGFDLRTESYKLFGVDLTQVPGLMAALCLLTGVEPGQRYQRRTGAVEGFAQSAKSGGAVSPPNEKQAWTSCRHYGGSPRTATLLHCVGDRGKAEVG